MIIEDIQKQLKDRIEEFNKDREAAQVAVKPLRDKRDELRCRIAEVESEVNEAGAALMDWWRSIEIGEIEMVEFVHQSRPGKWVVDQVSTGMHRYNKADARNSAQPDHFKLIVYFRPLAKDGTIRYDRKAVAVDFSHGEMPFKRLDD